MLRLRFHKKAVIEGRNYKTRARIIIRQSSELFLRTVLYSLILQRQKDLLFGPRRFWRHFSQKEEFVWKIIAMYLNWMARFAAT